MRSNSTGDLAGFSSETGSGSKFMPERGRHAAGTDNDAPKRGNAVGGTYLLGTKKLPPSLQKVQAWLSKKNLRQARAAAAPESDFRMDPNTGKLLEDDWGLEPATPLPGGENCTLTPSEYMETRPASPKYDEQVPWQNAVESSRSTPPSQSVKWNLPSSTEVEDDAAAREARRDSEVTATTVGTSAGTKGVSQITPPSLIKCGKESTPSSQAGYKFKQLVEIQSTSVNPVVLSLEIFAETRGSFLPDPKHDAVRAVALVYQRHRAKRRDAPLVLNLIANGSSIHRSLLSSLKRKHAFCDDDSAFFPVQSEIELLRTAVERINEADPDIIMGYEIQMESLGYLNARLAVLQPRESFLRCISRSPTIPGNSEMSADEYGQLHASGLHSAGRILLNLWRVLRSELKLSIYSFENCVHALMRTRVPHFTPADLTAWFKARSSQWRCYDHIAQRALLNLQMIECLDLVSRTCELARVYGIDFFSVLTRGSQYRVESLLLRLAHTQNFVLISPSKSQVANQSAMECLPLVMEPESRFYTSPVLVLDFQSLYPSMVMAYNLCYSTLVGHIESPGMASSLGVLSKYEPHAIVEGDLSPKELIFSPNGSLFSSKDVRKGVLPRMLQEILDTRQMLKKSMKDLPASQKALYRLLNSRQFALKLLANVTYGYTAAGFSGRMPCAELADAIVQFGRVTMENAIKLVEENHKWQAKVVYGDTDSIFVHLPGRSREEAFRIGDEIASEVTSMNPSPVFLKFEKVYHPCVLVTKKRYVGYAYESRDQSKPIFDAKGIETIRRDSCPAVSKLLERSLRTLFESKDLSLVKRYLQKQWEKIYKSKTSIQDFIFAKEVRLGTYSAKASVVPPAAIVAAKAMALDPRAEPKYAERVQYVVVHGHPGARLVDMVVSPETLVSKDRGLRLNEMYYISKQIVPALERVFSLLGADVRSWWAAMPKTTRWQPTKRPITARGLSRTIDHFFLSCFCAVCDEMTSTDQVVCDKCCGAPQGTSLALQARSATLEEKLKRVETVCFHCGGGDPNGGGVACSSLDCGVHFLRQKLTRQHKASIALMIASNDFL